MLFVRSKGQLGNQLFLFAAAMKARERGEKVFFIGFQDLASSFPEFARSFLRLPLRRNPLWLWRLSDRATSTLANWPALGRVYLSQDGDRFEKRTGKIPISIFDAGLCQRESLIDAEAVLALLKQEKEQVLYLPSKISKSDLAERKGEKFCFVHVRRGDYLHWPSTAQPAALPDSWFLKRMRDIERVMPGVKFFVVSDDPSHCELYFSAQENCTVIDLSEPETLRLMSSCDAGILSASTFSFWGALLASQNKGQLFIAPRYWVGWRQKTWYPEGIEKTSFLKWREVEF